MINQQFRIQEYKLLSVQNDAQKNKKNSHLFCF